MANVLALKVLSAEKGARFLAPWAWLTASVTSALAVSGHGHHRSLFLRCVGAL